MGFMDSIIRAVAPVRAIERDRARLLSDGLLRARAYYDGASLGRRAESWRYRPTDANAEGFIARKTLREVSRDLCRNNAWAARAKRVISHNMVGTGIIPNWGMANGRQRDRIEALTKAHLDGTSIDVLGRHNLYGLQNLVASTVVESGECLVRWRPRRAQDGLPLSFQLQVMEPDYLDPLKDGALANGGWMVQGIQYDPIGRIEGYWLYDRHPGSTQVQTRESRFIPGNQVAHVFWTDRAEEGRGIPWFAPVIQRLRDLGDYADAQLMRQKVSACFAAFITDDGTNSDGITAAGANDTYSTESLEPGMISHLRPGESVEFGNPPQVADYDQFVASILHEIAAGLGISYEALTGDLARVNFSSARMGWLEFQRSIDAWRNHMLIPQFCQRVAQWTLDAAYLEIGRTFPVSVGWTAPRREMISPAQEVPAIVTAIRAGLTSRSEEQRKLGFDPADLDAEIAEDARRADGLDLVFDSDPRKTTQNGGPANPAPAEAPPATAAGADSTAMVELMKAVVDKQPTQQNMSFVLPENVTVDAVKAMSRYRTDVETRDKAGRVLTMIKRPIDGVGPLFRVRANYDKAGRLIGHDEELLDEVATNAAP